MADEDKGKAREEKEQRKREKEEEKRKAKEEKEALKKKAKEEKEASKKEKKEQKEREKMEKEKEKEKQEKDTKLDRATSKRKSKKEVEVRNVSETPITVITSRTCAFSLKVRTLLEFKGLEYTLHYVDLSSKPEWFLQLNPKGETPVVKDGEQVIIGSDEAFEHFDQKYPLPSLVPTSVSAEVFQEVVKFVKEDFTPSFLKNLGAAEPKMQAEAKANFEKTAEKLNQLLHQYSGSGSHFFGEQVTKVDLYLAPFLDRLNFLEYHRGVALNSNHTALAEYARLVVHTPSYKHIRADQPTVKRNLQQRLPRPPVLSNNHLQHQSIRHHLADLLRKVDTLGYSDDEGLTHLAATLKNYANLILHHADMEENILFVVINEIQAGAAGGAHSEHEEEIPHLKHLAEQGTELLHALPPAGSEERKNLIDGLRTSLHTLSKSNLAHLLTEEKNLMPLAKELKDPLAVFKQISEFNLAHFKANPEALPFLLAGLKPHEIQIYLQNIETGFGRTSENFKTFVSLIKSKAYPRAWHIALERLPHLATVIREPAAESIVFVSGATGQVGFETIKSLAQNFPNIKIRAGVRDPAKASSKFAGINGVDLVQIDTSNAADLAKAIQGSHSLFVIPPAEGRIEVAKALIDAGKEAKVGFLAVLSVGAVGRKDVLFSRQFTEIETHAKETRIPWCFLRSEFFVENHLWDAGSVKAQGAFYAPVRPDARYNPVSLPDIGLTAATVLAYPQQHFGAHYHLTSSEAISLREVAGVYTQITHKPVKFHQAAPQDAIKGMVGSGVPQWQAEGIVELWNLVSERRNEEVTQDIFKITGKQATSVEEFLLQNAAAFKSD